MNDSPVSKVLNALTTITGHKPTGNSRGWLSRCPAHDDRQPSLSIAEGDDGRALLKCHAGCTTKAVMSALGLTVRDLMPSDTSPADRTPRSRTARTVSPAPSPTRAPTTYATARAAVAELERRHGPRSAMWTYHDAEGEPVGVIVRWNTPEGKAIRPIARRGASWIIGGMPTPRPLYHLPELATAQQVYICEGEPAADAIRSVGLIATTSAHGSKSAGKTDWSPLAGKECINSPDNDNAGQRYVDDVIELLATLTPVPTVKRIDLPDLPPSGDSVDYISARRTAGLDDDAIRAEIEALADAAEPIEPDQPVRAIDAFRPFPVEVLPEPLRSFVSEGALSIGCDPSYIALPLLSALAGAIGNSRSIQLKCGWTEPAIIWTAMVGESGTWKTPAFKLAMAAIRDRQADAMRRHAEETAAYQTRSLTYEKNLTAWKRAKTTSDPPEKPEEPTAERLIVSDTTVEALAPILLANPRGVLLARDELAGWIGSFDRYTGGRGGADAASWQSAHNGESIIVDRKTGHPRTIFIPSALVSVTGGVQPGILDRLLGQELRESGLLARLLLTMPPRRAKRWTEAVISDKIRKAIKAIFDRLYGLESDHDDNGTACPRIVRLTPDGKTEWVMFFNEHAQEQAELTAGLSAAWSKLEAYAPRLALAVHLVRWAAKDPNLSNPDAVDTSSIRSGIALCQWFCHEARRVYGILGESDGQRDRRQLVDLIRRKGGSMTARELMRSSRRFAKAADAEAALNELATEGIGRWEQTPPGPRGGKPSKRFVLADNVDDTPSLRPADAVDTDNTPRHGPGIGGIVNVSAVNAPADAVIDPPMSQPGPVDESPEDGHIVGEPADQVPDTAAWPTIPDGTPPEIAELASPRAGWTARSWQARLQQLADGCESLNPARADELRQAVQLLSS